MKPITKLNLNMNPAVCENGSLLYSRNMKVDKDGCLISDYGYKDIPSLSSYNIIGHIVGLDNKIYLFTDNEESVVYYSNYEFVHPFAINPDYFYKRLYTSKPMIDITDSDLPLNPGEIKYYYLDTPGLLDTNIPDYGKLSILSNGGITNKDSYFGFTLEYNVDYTKQDYLIAFFNKIKYVCQNIVLSNSIGGSTYATPLLYENNYVSNLSDNSNSDTTVIHELYFDINNDVTYPGSIIRLKIYSVTSDKLLVTYLGENVIGDEIGSVQLVEKRKNVSTVLEYDELNRSVRSIKCSWKYSGGDIDGCVTTNITGEKILTIAECNSNNNVDVPIKHINLSYCDYTDDESIYTQAPKVPIANLTLIDTYAQTIPNGVYIFFIRYEIRKDVYTKWYVCSRPMFAGVSEEIETLQGGLKYTNIHKDSAKSFVFDLSYINEDAISLYKKFQLGFIISHDDSVNARIWKSFNINTNLIYFDYDDISEIDIYELQKVTYELYNVHNITNFKNRLYISNYEESNFNAEELKNYANTINVQVITKSNVLSSNAIKINGNIIQKGDNQLYSVGEHSLSSILNENMIVWQHSNYIDTNHATTLTDAITIDLQDIKNTIVGVVATKSNLIGDYIFGNRHYEEYTGLYVLKTWDLRVKYHAVYIFYRKAILGISQYRHEWYDKGLTFAYSHNGVNNVIKLNNSTINNKPSSYKSGGNTITINVPHWEVYPYGTQLNSNEYADILTLAKTEIENQSRTVYAYIKIKDGQTDYYIDYTTLVDADNYIINSDILRTSDDKYGISQLGTTAESKFHTIIMNAIKDKIVGINDNSEIILNINGNNVVASNITVGCKEYKFTVSEIEDIDSSTWYKRLHVTLETNIHEYEWIIGFRDGIISFKNAGTDVHTQGSTLMPFSKYAIYVHFVDEHNIISNGVHVKDVTTSGTISNFDTFELQYEINAIGVSTIKYKAFFLSLKNIGDKIIEGFDFTFKPYDENTNEGWCYMSVIELDTLLYNTNNNITIIDNTGNIVTQIAAYYSSGVTNPIFAFGNCGFVKWHVDDITAYNGNNKFYIKIKNNALSNEYNNLIKVTPYIEYTLNVNTVSLGPNGEIIINHNWKDVIDGFYGAYLCDVKKPDFNISGNYYITGHDIYKVIRENYIELQDFTSNVPINDSVTHIIHSNFNLNYLTLTEDVNDQIFTIDDGTNKTKQIAKVLNSATLSSIYELKSMYKDFANIYFNSISEYNIIKFDNTIRVSNTLSDENFNNSVFYFNPTSYYNIPSNRGNIVKLFSIGNRIMVHTKAALYQFDANSILLSNNKDIKLKESDPFDTGLVNMIDSQYGYGGIDNKEAGCITFDSYFFYDNASNHIFGYAGQNQLVAIDDTIYSFIKVCSPVYCRTLHDEKNDRILFEFVCEKRISESIIRDDDVMPYTKKAISQNSEKNNVGYNIESFCLSYNYKTKSFVSFHDLTLNNAFATRYYSYSYNTNNSCCILFDRTNPIDLTNIETTIGTWNIYGIATNVSLIQFGAANYNSNHSPFAVVFIMQPTQSNLESLDSVTYEANIIKNAITYGSINQYTIVQNDIQDYTPAFYKNPVIRFYALTNLCISSEIDTTINDAVRPTILDDYKGFKYNKGRWSGNCFRNILNNNNVYEYPDRPNRVIINDDNSLVYGKFFALFFEFVQDVAIKFEDIIINSKKY